MSILTLFVIVLFGEYVSKQYIKSYGLYYSHHINLEQLFRIGVIGVIFYSIHIITMQQTLYQFSTEILLCSLVYIGYIDCCVQKIPNSYIVALSVVWFVTKGVQWFINELDMSQFLIDMSGIFVVLFVFGIIYVVSKGGVGAGDIKLLSIISLYVGVFHILPILFFICSLLMLTSIGLLVSKRATLKSVIPMGPFIAIGTILYIQQQLIMI